MSEQDTNKNIENNNVLGPGYEPLAVCLMILVIWMFFVAFTSKFFM